MQWYQKICESQQLDNIIGVPMTEPSNVRLMGPGAGDAESKERVALRLRQLVAALGELGEIHSITDLCDQADIPYNSWINAQAKSPPNRLSVENAAKLYRTFRISVNYTFLGLKDDLPPNLRRVVTRLERESQSL